MLATQDQVNRRIRNRLKTTAIGLGLVRLLQDARRFEEARTTLYALEEVADDAPAFCQASDPFDTAFVVRSGSNASNQREPIAIGI